MWWIEWGSGFVVAFSFLRRLYYCLQKSEDDAAAREEEAMVDDLEGRAEEAMVKFMIVQEKRIFIDDERMRLEEEKAKAIEDFAFAFSTLRRRKREEDDAEKREEDDAAKREQQAKVDRTMYSIQVPKRTKYSIQVPNNIYFGNSFYKFIETICIHNRRGDGGFCTDHVIACLLVLILRCVLNTLLDIYFCLNR